MSSDSYTDPPAKSELSKLNDEIRLCEEFLSLCDQVRKLEQFDDANLRMQQQKLAERRSKYFQDIQAIEDQIKLDESTLKTTDRPIGSAEKDTLLARIKNTRTRAISLHLSAAEAMKNIEEIEGYIRKKTTKLETLYQELEEKMEQGFHPNSVRERINSLRELRETLSDAKRENIPRKADQEKDAAGGEGNAPPNEVPLDEAEFFRYFAKDLGIAKTKVEILSPFIGIERARQVLPMLARLVAGGRNVVVRTRPPDEHEEQMKREALQIILDAHRLRITLLQKSNLQHNIAIIDERICWEGTVNILGPSQPGKTMRRILGTKNVRQLRVFLNDP